jgi:hypothetical protein
MLLLEARDQVCMCKQSEGGVAAKLGATNCQSSNGLQLRIIHIGRSMSLRLAYMISTDPADASTHCACRSRSRSNAASEHKIEQVLHSTNLRLSLSSTERPIRKTAQHRVTTPQLSLKPKYHRLHIRTRTKLPPRGRYPNRRRAPIAPPTTCIHAI